MEIHAASEFNKMIKGAGVSEKRLLIVDDEDVLLKTLVRVFVKEGFMVEAAENGRQALEALEQNHYDVVLTDFQMTPVDGIALLNSVKQSSPQTKVVILTAYIGELSQREAVNLGAFEVLSKPIAPRDLIRVIRRAADIQT